MPFDGNGNWSSTFSAVADRDASIKILASRFDNIFIDDLKNAFDNCVTRDGQGKPSTNTNANNYKVINVANPTNNQDAVNKQYLDGILSSLYPVGSIYIGTQETCPLATLISGSTWEAVSGRYLLASGTLDGTEEEYEATDTVDAGLPNLSGYFNGTIGGADGTLFKDTGIASGGVGTGGYQNRKITFDTSEANEIYGSSTTNRPTAYVVNVWRRTA